MASFPLPDAMASDVAIYLTPWCPYCISARQLLDGRGIPYEAVDVTGNHDARRWLRDNTGQRTVPQIFIKGQSVGGFDQLAQLDRGGALREMLA